MQACDPGQLRRRQSRVICSRKALASAHDLTRELAVTAGELLSVSVLRLTRDV